MWLSLLFPCGLQLQGSLPSHSLHLTQMTHTQKNRLGFAISMTQSHLEFSIDCAQWPCKGPCGERPPHLSELDHIRMRGRHGRLHPLTRRGCWRGLEYYFIGLLLQRRDLFVRIFHERGFKSQGNTSWEKKNNNPQRHAVFCRRSGGQVMLPAQTHVILSHPYVHEDLILTSKNSRCATVHNYIIHAYTTILQSDWHTHTQPRMQAEDGRPTPYHRLAGLLAEPAVCLATLLLTTPEGCN